MYDQWNQNPAIILHFAFCIALTRLPEAAEELFLDEMNIFEEERKMR